MVLAADVRLGHTLRLKYDFQQRYARVTCNIVKHHEIIIEQTVL